MYKMFCHKKRKRLLYALAAGSPAYYLYRKRSKRNEFETVRNNNDIDKLKTLNINNVCSYFPLLLLHIYDNYVYKNKLLRIFYFKYKKRYSEKGHPSIKRILEQNENFVNNVGTHGRISNYGDAHGRISNYGDAHGRVTNYDFISNERNLFNKLYVYELVLDKSIKYAILSPQLSIHILKELSSYFVNINTKLFNEREFSIYKKGKGKGSWIPTLKLLGSYSGWNLEGRSKNNDYNGWKYSRMRKNTLQKDTALVNKRGNIYEKYDIHKFEEAYIREKKCNSEHDQVTLNFLYLLNQAYDNVNRVCLNTNTNIYVNFYVINILKYICYKNYRNLIINNIHLDELNRMNKKRSIFDYVYFFFIRKRNKKENKEHDAIRSLFYFYQDLTVNKGEKNKNDSNYVYSTDTNKGTSFPGETRVNTIGGNRTKGKEGRLCLNTIKGKLPRLWRVSTKNAAVKKEEADTKDSTESVRSYDVTNANANVSTELVRSYDVTKANANVSTELVRSYDVTKANANVSTELVRSYDVTKANANVSTELVRSYDVTKANANVSTELVRSYDVTKANANVSTELVRSYDVTKANANVSTELVRSYDVTKANANVSTELVRSYDVTKANANVSTELVRSYDVTKANANVSTELVRSYDVTKANANVSTELVRSYNTEKADAQLPKSATTNLQFGREALLECHDCLGEVKMLNDLYLLLYLRLLLECSIKMLSIKKNISLLEKRQSFEKENKIIYLNTADAINNLKVNFLKRFRKRENKQKQTFFFRPYGQFGKSVNREKRNSSEGSQIGKKLCVNSKDTLSPFSSSLNGKKNYDSDIHYRGNYWQSKWGDGQWVKKILSGVEETVGEYIEHVSNYIDVKLFKIKRNINYYIFNIDEVLVNKYYNIIHARNVGKINTHLNKSKKRDIDINKFHDLYTSMITNLSNIFSFVYLIDEQNGAYKILNLYNNRIFYEYNYLNEGQNIFYKNAVRQYLRCFTNKLLIRFCGRCNGEQAVGCSQRGNAGGIDENSHAESHGREGRIEHNHCYHPRRGEKLERVFFYCKNDINLLLFLYSQRIKSCFHIFTYIYKKHNFKTNYYLNYMFYKLSYLILYKKNSHFSLFDFPYLIAHNNLFTCFSFFYFLCSYSYFLFFLLYHSCSFSCTNYFRIVSDLGMYMYMCKLYNNLRSVYG
ncbi:conserved Plasmodium protein, unknown function [Plasmodium ovale]|uniref:Uncharacterized protein n=1 Tax=Plasmodium ovale TaxID=36330 RepID=A0A1C3KRR9_PLAOA|nr:conserved Plasmodium protein, unknown function [Plasmodium ovale]